MEIACATGSTIEREVADELRGLLERFDLSHWRYTDRVVIEENAIPHSHPVLTLGTFNRGPFLLSSYLHEQLHWFALEHMRALERIYEEELLHRYPNVPVELPEGAGTEDSTYLHLFVCWWEIQALRKLVGEAKAGQIVEAMIERGVYRWVYRTLRDEEEQLGQVFRAAELPSPDQTRPRS